MKHRPSALLDTLRRVLADRGEVRLAVLFGSAATGRGHADSDVDLAILPSDPHAELRFELDLQAALEGACGRSVDLVRLDRASTLLRWEVARDGILVAATPAVEWARFRARAASEHADLAPALEEAAERFRRRLVERGAHA